MGSSVTSDIMDSGNVRNSGIFNNMVDLENVQQKSGPVRTAFSRYIKSGFVRKLFYRVHVLDQLKHFV